MVSYEVGLLLVGLAVLGIVALPRFLAHAPLSMPILYVLGGAILFSLPIGLTAPHPAEHGHVTERLTELVVIVSLMGAGLKLDRPFSWRGWTSTWRLLGVTMLITVAATSLVGWAALGLLPATAVLLGAVIAPTDPVLASSVEAGPPLAELEEDLDADEQVGPVRFALTSEAGLNDGLAFPFTYLAVAMAAAVGTGSYSWLGEWFAVDVVYRIVVGVAAGYVVGKLIARFVFRTPVTTDETQATESKRVGATDRPRDDDEAARRGNPDPDERAPPDTVADTGDDPVRGAEALAATLLAYGATELIHGYGFVAVFVAALSLRSFEWEHEYYRDLHDFAVLVERLLVGVVLVLFGGAVADGLLAPLTWLEALVGLAVVLVVRPLAGLIGLIGFPANWRERLVIAVFGIRGVGSFYYLAFALNEASFQEAELIVATDRLWALVGFIVLTSIVLHGVAVSPVMDMLDRWRERGPWP